MQSFRGDDDFELRKREKIFSQTSQDTIGLYQSACEYGDDAEFLARVSLDYGLRVGELTHGSNHWVEK